MTQPLIAQALAEGRAVLFEHELYALLAEQGLAVPRHRFLPADLPLTEAALADFAGGPAVLKIVSPRIVHKSDVGGVRMLPSVAVQTLGEAMWAMRSGLPAGQRGGVRGFLLVERVAFEPALGGQWLIGLRATEAFGAVATVGFGGTAAEALDGALRPERATALWLPDRTAAADLKRKLAANFCFAWATGAVRGVPPLAAADAQQAQLERFVLALAAVRAEVLAAGAELALVECNPVVRAADGRFLPLDARAALGPPPVAPLPVPAAGVHAALHPQSVAIVGASPRGNVGHTIVACLVQAGFRKERIYPIRADGAPIAGVPAVASLDALPGPVDLLVLAIAAAGVPALLDEVFARDAARAVLLIPGGMGETEGGAGIEREVRALLAAHAARPNRPVLLGNNSLGLVSRPDHVDTLFIPATKLPRPQTAGAHVALISQSGAFMVTRTNRLPLLNPAYLVSLGNQVDLGLADTLETLAADPAVTTFALYVEGFKAGDGLRTLRLVRELTAAGRDVIAYKAGRSTLGEKAAAGHTAALAGDYRVAATLLRDAGALIAESFEDFLDAIRLSAALRAKTVAGRRVGLLSNAGYESVGMADALGMAGGGLCAAEFSPETDARLRAALAEGGILPLVNVLNPLDLTPMANDATHAACLEALLADPGVDLAIAGVVPLTARLKTLPAGLDPRDVFDARGGYAERVARQNAQSPKPLVVVVDGGPHYDPLAQQLEAAGLPVFRSADRAVRLTAAYVAARLAAAAAP